MLDELLPPELKVQREITLEPHVAQRVLDAALAAGHEGVVIKGVDSLYERAAGALPG